MKVVVWNCRGAGGPLTIPQLKEVLHFHSPNVVFLSETKNQEKFMRSVQKKIRFEKGYVVNSIGKAGGMALYWNNAVTIDHLSHTDWYILACITDKEVNSQWWLMCVHASTDSNIRKEQWKHIAEWKKGWGEEWVMVGDFNDLLSNGEKWGGRVRAESSFKDFYSFIRDNELLDIGYKGLPRTWSNYWEGEGEVKERLDRGLCSAGWLQRFDRVVCTHIENDASDHAILMVDTNPEITKRKMRFYFDQRWTKNPDMKEVIQGAWRKVQIGSRMYKITRKIKEVRVAILEWRRKVQGNSKVKIKELKEKLKEVKEEHESGNKSRVIELKNQLSKAYEEEELYWSQKSRSKWLKEGDRNTAYFHTTVKAKRKRNTISTLEKQDGTWCKSEEEIEVELCQYYNDLFTTTNPDDFEEILKEIPSTISRQMNAKLIKPVEEKDIRQALFSMHPNKAPGKDGMSPLFFQHYWHIIKGDLVLAINSFFHSGCLLKTVNETIISLIPKIDSPTSVLHYRPISLCNVLYKIISKIIANRLKHVLQHYISNSQSAFIPGRQILDNVVVAHEILHFLKNKRKGSTGYMAIKLDMSKAYDRVEWIFVGRLMLKMGFCPIFVKWIMACLSTVTYSFNLNGQKVGNVIPTRGIRQGDPLSPYLFIICAEGLSSLIHKAVQGKELTGVKICRDSLVISHLFFADDSLLCCKATGREALKVKSILTKYGNASGQVVNYEKSALFFSKNTKERMKHEISEGLDNMKEAVNGTYLGLPMAIGRSKAQVFGFVKNKISSKLQGWKQRLLSEGGKEVLIKAVTMAMPTYVMTCFRLPKGLCREISGKIAKFWWGKGEREASIHWASWKKLSEVKGRGEIGFRDLEAFNTALLAKQIWRFLTAPNLLVSKAELIERIPTSIGRRMDRLIWKFSKTGAYTVKTGYARARQEENQISRNQTYNAESSWEVRKRTVWKNLWHQKNSPNIVSKAQVEWLEYEHAREEEKEQTATANIKEHQMRGQTAGDDDVCLFTDAAISSRMIRTGQGIVARKWNGMIMKAKAIVNQYKGEPSKEEALAIRNAMLMAK
ncbi:uncharacterized protein [Coffea arabica]|uniref:Reverse transcriptase domain-containing protein n=1 Tax=Coffea arabica TaxID=13443 RepID=A0ABM4X7I6_COFAR